jgi:exodeoxyribonuclease VII large subunit
MLEPKIYSVSRVNGYIRTMLENDFVLSSIWVAGEISNFKRHSSGHMYFSLKDSDGVIRCVMFRGDADILPFMPENGMSVIVCGYVTVYEKSGEYQIVVQLMKPDGVGALTIAFEQLKQKLADEGLFDSDYKREINRRPSNIAVVTSPTGAAVRDIIKIIRARNSSVSITVIPVLVQGEMAAESVAEGIRLANRLKKADTIIVGRGGGSIEDLWAFNDERVARAIFASEIPVISAVGHETDFTIADFVADLRASTPSNAAELAVNDINEDIRRAEALKERLRRNAFFILSNKEERYKRASESQAFLYPERELDVKEKYLRDIFARLKKETDIKIKTAENRLQNNISTLEALSPLKVLARGYSYTEDTLGNVISSAEKINEKDNLFVTFSDGKIKVSVENKVMF